MAYYIYLSLTAYGSWYLYNTQEPYKIFSDEYQINEQTKQKLLSLLRCPEIVVVANIRTAA